MRFWWPIVLGILLVKPCFAQPPVELVGQSEQICVINAPDADGRNDCTTLPSPRKSNALVAPGNAITLRPTGFETTNIVAAREDERGDGFYIFGNAQSSAGALHLAFSRQATLKFPESWEYFAGRGLAGTINWVGHDHWSALSKPTANNRTKLFSENGVCDNYQINWNDQLGRWLMLYSCGGHSNALVRVARQAWGPWSDAISIQDQHELGKPHAMVEFDAVGPVHIGHRTTTIYWKLSTQSATNQIVYRSILQQEGTE